MARSVSNSHDQAATLRNLKMLVVLLVVSNILVGVLGVYLLRAVDKRYSELVSRSVPTLNDLRELMSDTVAAMRASNPRNFTGPGSNEPAMLEAMRVALRKTEDFRANLLNSESLKQELADQTALRQTGEVFSSAVREVIEIYATGRRADGVREREEKLLPAFDRHMAAIGRAADTLESLSLVANRDYTSRTNSLTTIVLGVASWPVIVLLGLLVLTAVFVIAMMVAFRGKDLVDTP